MVVTAWIVLTLAFVLFTVKPDPNIAFVRFAAAFGGGAEAERAAVEAYKAAHNYDVPVLERYVKWMSNYATLRWGTTLEGVPIAALIGHAIKETLKYLVPSLVVSTVVAHGLGLYMAFNRGGLVDKLGTALAYGGYGVPAFFAAELAFGVLLHEYGMLWLQLDTAQAHQDTLVPMAIDEYLLPMAVLTGHLIAIQLVFIRSEVAEQLNADFMKTLRSSGARNRDLARHALRNATVPLISSFFAQILTILYLDIIAIEVAIGPQGFGHLTFNAFTNQDLGLILGVALVPVAIGLVGNLLQDLAYTVLDPRVDYSSAGSFGLRDRLPTVDVPVRTQVAVVGLVVLVVFGAVGAFGGLGGLGGPGDAGPGERAATPEPGLTVRIGYDGEWRLYLAVTANGTTEDRSLVGNGNEVIELDPNATFVRASVQKQDDSPSKLTLQIVKDGELLDSASTAEEYGSAQLVKEF
jgi:peptide/nickel transport system permease protein